MKKKIIWSLVVVALIGGLIALKVKDAKGSAVKSVKTQKVAKGDLQSYLSTTGTVKSKNKKEYYGAQMKVKSVNVKVGDAVKKGQALVTYDYAEMASAQKTAQLQYDNAVLSKKDTVNQNSSVESQKTDLDAQIKALEGSNNPQNFEMVQKLKQQRASMQGISSEKLKQLDNSVALAKSQLDSANAKLNDAKNGLVSDIDGVVTAVSASEGSVGNPAQPMVVVQDLSSLKVAVSLGKFDASKIKVDQEAKIKSGDKMLKGKVSFVSPAAVKSASPTGGDTTLAVEVDVLEAAPDLKVDFDTDVSILMGEVKDAVKMPAECVKTDKSGKNTVFVLENSIAKEKEVKIGLQSDLEVQILEGLKEGDKVILNPSSSITDGAKVVEAVEGAKKK